MENFPCILHVLVNRIREHPIYRDNVPSENSEAYFT